jgi:hypothetical protein
MGTEQERDGERSMSANTVTTIVTMLAQGRPVWYVAAVTKLRVHEVHSVGVQHGYPYPDRLRRAATGMSGPSAA